MFIFKNFIVVMILIGALTRLSNHIFSKYMRRSAVIYVTPVAVGIFVFPLVVILVGFDVVIAEYVMAIIFFFLFDLIRQGRKQ